ncbi:MAG: hypothetical protein PHI22_04570, partial [Bacilli bacterium]|nr:hypothetical protein [Bacilli bacterium]
MDVCTEELKPIVGFIKSILQIIQILIPIGLIVLGTIDLGKAVIASKEEEIKKNQMVLLKRAIAAVLVFLVATLAGFVIGFVGNDQWKTCWRGATQCEYGFDPVTGGCRT